MFQTKLLIAALAFGGTQAVTVQAERDDSCSSYCNEHFPPYSFGACMSFCGGRGLGLAQIEADDWYDDVGPDEDGDGEPDSDDLAQISRGAFLINVRNSPQARPAYGFNHWNAVR